jgi:phosphoenolpyruvate carboxykinase (GTP)
LGAEATFAAEGMDGVLRYDPMSMRPFLSYPEAKYAEHWLKIIGQAQHKPVFAHVNWFQRDAKGRYIWPGYTENLRALLWLLDFAEGHAVGEETPVGVLPRESELNLDGLDILPADLARLLSIDYDHWRTEMVNRESHLQQFDGLPDEIWEAHRHMKAALGE